MLMSKLTAAMIWLHRIKFGELLIALLICVPMSKIRQKLAYPAKYIRMHSTDHQIFSVGW